MFEHKHADKGLVVLVFFMAGMVMIALMHDEVKTTSREVYEPQPSAVVPENRRSRLPPLGQPGPEPTIQVSLPYEVEEEQGAFGLSPDDIVSADVASIEDAKVLSAEYDICTRTRRMMEMLESFQGAYPQELLDLMLVYGYSQTKFQHDNTNYWYAERFGSMFQLPWNYFKRHKRVDTLEESREIMRSPYETTAMLLEYVHDWQVKRGFDAGRIFVSLEYGLWVVVACERSVVNDGQNPRELSVNDLLLRCIELDKVPRRILEYALRYIEFHRAWHEKMLDEFADTVADCIN